MVDMVVLAKIAYQAYGEVTGFKNYQGLPMPKWDDLSDTIKKAWANAALAVLEEMNNRQAHARSVKADK